MHKLYDHKELAARIKLLIRNDRLFRDIHFSRETLTKELGISPARISQIFKEELGTTFYDYVNRQRVYHARHLLKSPTHKNDTLEDIAIQSGFCNRMTMHRMYMKVYGISPGEERKNESKK